jgi:hypothetical protein
MEVTSRMRNYMRLSAQCEAIVDWQTSKEHRRLSKEAIELWRAMSSEEREEVQRLFASKASS